MMRQDGASRFGEIVSDIIRPALGTVEPLCLTADVDENCATTGAVTGLGVVEDIANKPGAAQVNVVVARRAQNQRRLRFAAVAGERIAFDCALWMVRAVIKVGQRNAGRSQKLLQPLENGPQRGLCKVSARHARLVAHDNEAITGVLQRAQTNWCEECQGEKLKSSTAWQPVLGQASFTTTIASGRGS